MYIQSFYKLLSVASSLKGEHTMAVVRADDEDVLDAVVDAQEAHMARSILIGDTAKIQRILEKHRIDWRDYTILQEDNDVRAAKLGVQLVRQGMPVFCEGPSRTGTLMREVVSPERGIRTRRAALAPDVLRARRVQAPVRDRRRHQYLPGPGKEKADPRPRSPGLSEIQPRSYHRRLHLWCGDGQSQDRLDGRRPGAERHER